MKDNQKPQYSILQNLSYVVKLVWKESRLLLFFTTASSLVGIMTSLVQLYIAPIILRKVEQSVPLTELFLTIGLFTLALMACNSINT